jgi:Tn3 transposase DDE domain
MLEIGPAQKTIFVARYLRDRSLQREIEEGLNVRRQRNAPSTARSAPMTSASASAPNPAPDPNGSPAPCSPRRDTRRQPWNRCGSATSKNRPTASRGWPRCSQASDVPHPGGLRIVGHRLVPACRRLRRPPPLAARRRHQRHARPPRPRNDTSPTACANWNSAPLGIGRPHTEPSWRAWRRWSGPRVDGTVSIISRDRFAVGGVLPRSAGAIGSLSAAATRPNRSGSLAVVEGLMDGLGERLGMGCEALMIAWEGDRGGVEALGQRERGPVRHLSLRCLPGAEDDAG